MARKYFGTDGMRGEANKDLTPEIVMKLGFALGRYLSKNKEGKPKIIMGTDTRVSGYMIRSALFAGLTSMGVNTDFVGVLPTPGVAYLTRTLGADAGIMISASHNPAKDNGIKIFSSDGFKLPDKAEEELEELMDCCESLEKYRKSGDDVGKFKYSEDDFYHYQNFIVSTVDSNFKGLKIILDTANGASYRIAPRVFYELGAEIVAINNIPNGTNINVNCGSTNMEILQKVVQGYSADLGLAFDGDADRLLVVDRHGNVVDGDKLIGIIATHMKEKGTLKNDTLVSTVMSNLGLENYLTEKGIKLIRTKVGDRYVLEEMRKDNLNLGGEQSGHIIFSDYNTTGDGLLTAVQLVAMLKEEGKLLDEAVKEIGDFPQKLVNIEVSREKRDKWDTYDIIKDYIDKKEEELGDKGRILVRPSGTEAKIRVMVEAKEESVVEEISASIAELIRKELS